MEQTDYSSSIVADVGATEALETIISVADWWTRSVVGACRFPGDRFTVRWGDTFVSFEVTEFVPAQRAVWLVTDCNLAFVANKTEWKETKVKWDLSPEDGKTRVTMTHVGLVPGIECYENCEAGWNFYFTESLLKLLTEGKGLPDGKGRQSERAKGA